MIRQFDVIENPSVRSRPIAPYLVVVQSQFYDETPTLLVAPLLKMPIEAVLTSVSLRVEFEGDPFVLLLSEMGAIDRRPPTRLAGSLGRYEDDIRRALDRLFTGF
ncbi:CcdB family protein [Brevundimonas sp.]|uniref:CcdB family protein n=1 Tax=Brevundimonas sp. TaxID=1871086 RepID=UPI002D22244B|nr:CcdB family protein [Brevundimonas sp.]HYC67997.1 CcdB family protein [Brevundimonas sp.]